MDLLEGVLWSLGKGCEEGMLESKSCSGGNLGTRIEPGYQQPGWGPMHFCYGKLQDAMNIKAAKTGAANISAAHVAGAEASEWCVAGS